uniref:Uncharacterized protein n=1 Tax=Rhizophora mucronata TaxID=61149 RepID=A0A2P2IST9_RHIMU
MDMLVCPCSMQQRIDVLNAQSFQKFQLSPNKTQHTGILEILEGVKLMARTKSYLGEKV